MRAISRSKYAPSTFKLPASSIKRPPPPPAALLAALALRELAPLRAEPRPRVAAPLDEWPPAVEGAGVPSATAWCCRKVCSSAADRPSWVSATECGSAMAGRWGKGPGLAGWRKAKGSGDEGGSGGAQSRPRRGVRWWSGGRPWDSNGLCRGWIAGARDSNAGRS